MTESQFIAYYRVSTAKQGQSGLGLEAQRKSVEDYLTTQKYRLVAEFTEIESGKKIDRPELDKALSTCRLHKATLVIAKLDRLARNAHFLLGLEKAGIEFVCCDMPTANRLTVGILAMVAEEEARLISVRTKAALAAAKARGVKLGNPENATPEGRLKGSRLGVSTRKALSEERAADRLPYIEDAKTKGIKTLRGIADELNRRKIPAPNGGMWHASQVKRILLQVSNSSNEKIRTRNSSES